MSDSAITILLWCMVALFIAIAISSYAFSFVFYKKKLNSDIAEEFRSYESKIKAWWNKYRSSGCFCLGVIFSLLSAGAIYFMIEALPGILNTAS